MLKVKADLAAGCRVQESLTYVRPKAGMAEAGTQRVSAGGGRSQRRQLAPPPIGLDVNSTVETSLNKYPRVF